MDDVPFKHGFIEGLDLQAHSLNVGPCWVCGISVAIESHHIIPCAYGGVDGPQINLCAIDHELVHSLSYHLANDEWHDVVVKDERLRRMPKTRLLEALDVILYLSQRIKNARELTKGDINKGARVMSKLDAQQHKELKALAKYWNINQDLALQRAITETYKKYHIT